MISASTHTSRINDRKRSPGDMEINDKNRTGMPARKNNTIYDTSLWDSRFRIRMISIPITGTVTDEEIYTKGRSFASKLMRNIVFAAVPVKTRLTPIKNE
jgi:hypothetical protein